MLAPRSASAINDPVAEDVYPPSSNLWHAAGVLMIVWAFAFLDRQILTILIESIHQDIGVSDTQISLVQGVAFSVSSMLAGIALGRLVDVGNRRNILIFGLLLWSVMTMLCGFAQNFWHLFFARVGVGLGEACLAPASMSFIADLARPARRGLAMGIVFAGTAVGSAGSIFFGGMMLEVLGADGSYSLLGFGPFASWQLIFMLVGAPGFIAAALMCTLKEPKRRETAQLEAGLGAFLVFFGQQKAAFLLTILAFTMTSIIGYAIPVWTPVILMRVYGVPPGQVGLFVGGTLLVCGVLASTLGGGLGDKLFRRLSHIGRLGPLLIGYPLQASVMVAWLFHDSATWALLAFALAGPLLGHLVSSSAYGAQPDGAQRELRGKTLAFYALVTSLAGAGLAPTAVALITDFVFKDPAMVRYSVLAVCTPAAIAGILLAIACVKPYRLACVRTAGAVAPRGAVSGAERP